MLSIDGGQRATLLAALRYFQEGGQGEPSNRSDEIHDLATNAGQEISLDDRGIDELCEALNFGRWAPRPVPQDKAGWAAIAKERGWSDAVLSHAVHSQSDQFDNECVIELPGDISLHMPAHPLPCEYLRVVDRTVGTGVELMYWHSDEWRDEPAEVIGTVMGMVKGFQPNLAVQLENLRVPPICYERTADDGEMACYIAGLATDEVIVDVDTARLIVLERFPKVVWRHEVANDETQLGYWEWAMHEAEAEQKERETVPAVQDSKEGLPAQAVSDVDYVVIQKGGSSGELYLSAWPSEGEAVTHRFNCRDKGGYMTSPVIEVSRDLAGEPFYEAVEEFLRAAAVDLSFPEGEAPADEDDDESGQAQSNERGERHVG